MFYNIPYAFLRLYFGKHIIDWLGLAQKLCVAIRAAHTVTEQVRCE